MVFFPKGTKEDCPSSYFPLLEMRSCAVKLVALFLLSGLGFYLATSSILLDPQGDKKGSSSHVFDCNGVLRRITAKKEGNFGCENLGAVKHKPLHTPRSLRVLLMPPPSPIRNRPQAMLVPSAPSPLIP